MKTTENGLKNSATYQPFDRETRLMIARTLFDRLYAGEPYSPAMLGEIMKQLSNTHGLNPIKLGIEIQSIINTCYKVAGANNMDPRMVLVSLIQEIEGKIKKTSWIDKLYDRVFN
jgi:hypothetical protein